MKSSHRLTLAALVVSAALAAAGAVWAQDPPAGDPPAGKGGDGMRRGWSQDRQSMAEKLKPTDEQRKKIDDIRYQHQKASIAMRGELEGARLDLGRLMRADQPDARAINAQIDKVNQARVSLEKDRVAQLLEMRAVLTPDQLKIFRENRGGMRGGMRGMHMHGGEMPGTGGPGAPGMGGGMGGPGDSMWMGGPMGDPDSDDPGPDAGPPGV